MHLSGGVFFFNELTKIAKIDRIDTIINDECDSIPLVFVLNHTLILFKKVGLDDTCV